MDLNLKADVDADTTALIVRDLHPTLEQAGTLGGEFLRIPTQVVGLMADISDRCLKPLRRMVQGRRDAIPLEHRVEPPLRITCETMQAAYCIEDPELQRMFAELLGAACDDRVAEKVQPGFATVISQMSRFDATLFSFLVSNFRNNRFQGGVTHFMLERDFPNESNGDVRASIDNFVRLRLVEWVTSRPTTGNIGPRSRDYFGVGRFDAEKQIKELESQVENLHRELQAQGNALKYFVLTRFGKNLADVCLPIEAPVVDASTVKDQPKPE